MPFGKGQFLRLSLVVRFVPVWLSRYVFLFLGSLQDETADMGIHLEPFAVERRDAAHNQPRKNQKEREFT